MEYSEKDIMTRKEYLKKKNPKGINFNKFKYLLLIVVIILLGIYVFKQLNLYNNVTKIANKMMEESALAKTMKMYYVSDSYTKKATTTVMLYKSSDDSRTKIKGSENLSNIQLYEDRLYGLDSNTLYYIDLTSFEKVKLTDNMVKEYAVSSNLVYFYSDNKKQEGLYTLDLDAKVVKKIYTGKIYQMCIDENAVYIITKGKTSRSIIKLNRNGNIVKRLTDKQMVSNMTVLENLVMFVNSLDGKLYSIDKDGNNIKFVTKDKVLGNTLGYKDYIYYICKNDGNSLHKLNLKSGDKKKVINKNIDSIQIDNNIIYYKLSNSLGIYKYDVLTENTKQVTSVRTDEYICIN